MRRIRHGEDLLMLAVGAILTGLMLVFPRVGFLQWITMIPLIIGAFRICSDESVCLRHAYGYGFLTVFLYYMVLYHWFVNLYPLDFAGLDRAASVVVVVAGWVGLSLLQAIVGGLIFLALRAIDQTGILKCYPLVGPFAFAALWVVFEWSSTLSWTGVPWGRLALGQIEYLSMLQSASLLGSYFVSFLILVVNGLLAYAILYRRRELLCIGLSIGLVVANLTYGLLARTVEPSVNKTAHVAVIQGNISSHEKWSGSDHVKGVYADLTEQAVIDGAEIVIWPETVLPYVLNYNEKSMTFLSELAIKYQITLVVGSFYTSDSGEDYNALYMVDPDGTIREEYYAKRHLVPFGEYIPMEKLISVLIPPLAELSKLSGSLTEGEDSGLFETEHGNLGSLICFDSIYEQLTIDSVRDGAELMMVSSNDSWFRDSAAVYQHQAQSQLRAIESGRFFVRSANTGISTIVAPDGELLGWIDPLESGYAVHEVGMISEQTLYDRIGNLFVYLCIGGVLLLFGAGLYQAKRDRKARFVS